MAAVSASLVRCNASVISAAAPRLAARRLSAVAPRTALRLARASKLAELETNSKADKKAKREEEEEEEFEGDAEDGLSPQQVESLLSVLCEETQIAEVELKMGGFKMRVRRNVGATAAAAPAAAPAPVAAAPAPTPVPAPVYESYSVESTSEDFDESLVGVVANKVGILRRGRFVKGKQVGKGPVVNEGDTVRKGQPLAYIEQLGTHWPIEAPQGGEVVEFLVEDGEPVEYKQVVVEIAPAFGSTSPGDTISV